MKKIMIGILVIFLILLLSYSIEFISYKKELDNTHSEHSIKMLYYVPLIKSQAIVLDNENGVRYKLTKRKGAFTSNYEIELFRYTFSQTFNRILDEYPSKLTISCKPVYISKSLGTDNKRLYNIAMGIDGVESFQQVAETSYLLLDKIRHIVNGNLGPSYVGFSIGSNNYYVEIDGEQSVDKIISNINIVNSETVTQ